METTSACLIVYAKFRVLVAVELLAVVSKSCQETNDRYTSNRLWQDAWAFLQMLRLEV